MSTWENLLLIGMFYLLFYTPVLQPHPYRTPVFEKLHEKIEKHRKEQEFPLAVSYYEYSDVLDSCSLNPCRNHGKCVSTAPGYQCQCNEFFTGQHCEKPITNCTEDLCIHGICVLKKISPNFKCRCDYPYHGPRCNTAADVCSPNPCKNDGICAVRDNNRFRCICPLHYKGTFCEVGPNDCYRNDGLQYRGHVSYTERGLPCLPWDSYLLAKENMNSFVSGIYMYGIGEHNYCRNPDGEVKPWCYFKDGSGKLSWGVCNVTVCTDNIIHSVPVVRSVNSTTDKPIVATDLKGNITKRNTTLPTQGNTTFSTCGLKDIPTSIRGRIFGGKRTQPGQHPWLASLQLKVSVPPYAAGHICGGTLIAPCWILTAAHCVKTLSEPQIWRVFLGKTDLIKNETYQQSFDVRRIIIHEFYREEPRSLHYDIALMELKKINKTCAKESKFVKKACIANREFAVGKACTIAGWGRMETGLPSQLLDATVQLISHSACSDPKRYGKLIDDSMLCAGVPEGGVDACQGDSGGPLICERSAVSQVAGVVSWGELCGVKDKPGVYAHVFKFAQWIESKMKGN
ncbi:hyaluronan-binding protein 2 [Pelobates fuscus]|uniref:hyaluronan-binding protein 2 n=1 Tax=Pelobates fuscus TaxID=191477 RepID=UPI002FE4C534